MHIRRKVLTGRVLLLVVVLLAGTTVGTSVAEAGNTHSINYVYHGCGDCAGHNAYVHPFTESSTNARKWSDLVFANNATWIAWCYCTHSHISWDTSPYHECYYSSRNGSDGPPFLNHHGHWNHYGGCA